MDVASLSERQRAIIEHIRKVLQEGGEGNLVSLERIKRNRLNEFVKEVSDVLGHIKNSNITETNNLVRAATVVVTHNLGISGKAQEELEKNPFGKGGLLDK